MSGASGRSSLEQDIVGLLLCKVAGVCNCRGQHVSSRCAGKQVESLQLKIAEMQTSADLGSRQMAGLQHRLNGLLEDKKQLEACLDDLEHAQEVPHCQNTLRFRTGAQLNVFR